MNQKIQIIRGISACAVIMIHSNARGITGIAIRPFINFAVPMFIFCSGYLTKSKYNDYKQFYIKRLTKIMIPYILWTLIYTILFNNYNNLYINLLTANAIRPFYFLFVYAQFVILTPIIIKLIYSKYQQLGWWITPISIFIIQYICNFLGIQLGFPFPSTLFPVWFTYYYLGIILGNKIITNKYDYKYIKIIYGVTLAISEIESFLWWYILNNKNMATTQIRLTSLVTSSISCLLVHSFVCNDNVNLSNHYFINQLFIIIGNYSFGIYLAHVGVMTLLKKSYFYNSLIFPFKSILILVVTLLSTILAKKLLGKYAKYLG